MIRLTVIGVLLAAAAARPPPRRGGRPARPLRWPGEVAGTVTRRAAELTGLPPGVPHCRWEVVIDDATEPVGEADITRMTRGTTAARFHFPPMKDGTPHLPSRPAARNGRGLAERGHARRRRE